KDLEILRAQYGLDKSIYVQFWIFLKNALRGDFGYSYHWNEPALGLVLGRIPATLELAFASLFVTCLIALPIGILSAVKKGSLLDRIGKTVALAGQSMPTFWIGIMLILILSVKFRLLPTSGRGDLRQLFMPAFTLGWFSTAALVRLTRSAMLDVLDSEHIKMVRAKGVPERVVIFKHALKNASIPIVTLLGFHVAYLISGSVIVETIFAWPGVGRIAIQAIHGRDYPVVQAAVFLTSIWLIATNLFVDILYSFIDPRIRFGNR
ncbi:MAG: ABC transporter permease, partial [Candidatus Tectomicrobia bacterium]|nr:ABC transporter permease [Candidatus Tectomicrobia bacterium]